MLIACPDCNAGYDVPDALLSSTRMMRCAACGHDWMTDAVETKPIAFPARDDGWMPNTGTSIGTGTAGPEVAQIDCPACAASYELPAVMLTQPRMMRCATCGHDWETVPRAAAAPTAPAARTAIPEAPTTAAPIPTSPISAADTQADILDAETPMPADAAPEPPASPDGDRVADLAGAAMAAHQYELDGDAGTRDESDEIANIRATAEVTALGTPALGLAGRIGATLRTSRISLIGWTISVAVLLIMAQTLVDKRAALAESWPPSQRLFLWLGLG